MKKSLYVIALWSVFTCFLYVLPAQNIGVIPTPRQIEIKDGFYQFSGTPQTENLLVDTLPVKENVDQAYVLEVTPQKVIVRYTTEVGLFYANQSLNQMVRFYSHDNTCQIPCMLVTDYPAMKYRGWMDDISRGPIPNMAFLKREIETMAQYKMNFFNLYTEHVFKLDEYPDVAPADGLTADEIRELEEFAAQYHIELWGNQQCLAHAEKTLRIPFYKDMADTKTTLNVGSEKTYDFLKYQLETVSKAYRSSFFNINCDETEALGDGMSKRYVDSVGGASQAYANHVKWVYDVLKKQGKRVAMWGDIVAKDPALASQLPKDMLMLAWCYAASDSYVDMLQPFKQQGFDYMVAPGMSMWSTVYPSYLTYTKNIANLVRDGYQNGAIGMMNTAWDDSGESLFNSAWHGMAWAAEMSWKPIENVSTDLANMERINRLEVFDALFEKTFVASFEQNQQMCKLEKYSIKSFFSTDGLYEDVFDFYPSKVGDKFFFINESIIKQLNVRLLQYDFHKMEKIDQAKPQYVAPMRFAHYVYLRAKVVAQKNALRYKLYQTHFGNSDFPKSEIQNDVKMILADLHKMKNEYLKLWDEECRQYGRDVVEGRFDMEAQKLMNIPNHVFVDSKLNEKGETMVYMWTLFGDQDIYYSIDGRQPVWGENKYSSPIVINQSATIRAITRNDMQEDVLSERYVLLHKGLNRLSKLNTQFSSYRAQYSASGPMALADGVMGGNSYADGTWQGYSGTDISADFDFRKKIEIHSFKTRFFQNVYDWIMAPSQVEIYISSNGHDYELYQTLTVPNVNYSASSTGIYSVQSEDLNIKTRYMRIVAKNGGALPSWHWAAGEHSYIFCDEFIIQ